MLTVTPSIGYRLKEGTLKYNDVAILSSSFIMPVADVTITAEFEIAPPHITTTSLPAGAVGSIYSQALASTGSAPVAWNLENGILPDGLALSTDGLISGTPTATGAFSFTVKATNSAGSDTRSLSMKVVDFILGDITGTGEVGPADLVRLARYIAGHPDISINERAARVTGNDNIGPADLVRLARFIAGHPVTLGR